MGLQILSKAILDPYRRGSSTLKVAIVGNGGTSESDIDIVSKSDCVIRFNNFATREKIEHAVDRSRCDILFSTFDLHSHLARPKDVVIGIPFPFNAESIHHKIYRWYGQSRKWMVNPYENMDMCKEMKCESLGFKHPFPSIGFTALWHMINYDAEFYITGFEWYYDDATNKIQNWDIRKEDYPKCWNHNYPREVKWIIDNICPKNNFIFSKRSMHILQSQHALLTNGAP